MTPTHMLIHQGAFAKSGVAQLLNHLEKRTYGKSRGIVSVCVCEHLAADAVRSTLSSVSISDGDGTGEGGEAAELGGPGWTLETANSVTESWPGSSDGLLCGQRAEEASRAGQHQGPDPHAERGLVLQGHAGAAQNSAAS